MPEVRRITVDEFFAHPDAAALLDEYAAESSIVGMPTPQPARPLYETLEASGAMHVLAAFDGDAMLGFLALLVSLNPHYNAVIGVTESYFVAREHRKSGAGLRLLHAAERLADERGAVGLLISAPAGGRLAEVLDGYGEYRETNRVFFRGFK
jgi:GNAT superfamily N-acetyltransferase